MAVKIVVDSACDVNVNEAASRGLQLMSMEITFGSESFLDGETLIGKQFYEKLIETSDLPKTSQINEFRWEECFAANVEKGDEVVAIVLSSKLSSTYNSAVKAAKKFGDKVYVVDSMNACIGERLVMEYALRLAEAGESAKSIFDKLQASKNRIRVLAVLGTLKYLKKGGRISPLVAFVGEALNVKPVVGVVDGEVKLLGKAMGSKKGNNMINTLVSGGKGIDFSMPVATAYSGLDDSVLKKYIEDSKNLWKDYTEAIPEYIIGSTIGTHVGPGAVAVAFFEKE